MKGDVAGPGTRIAQLAERLIEVANELLDAAGKRESKNIVHYSEGPLLRTDLRRFYANSESVALSRIESQILDILLRNRNELVTKAQLCEALGLDLETRERNLKSYVYRLKSKLNKMKQSGVKIQAIHGAGYVLSTVNEQTQTISA